MKETRWFGALAVAGASCIALLAAQKIVFDFTVGVAEKTATAGYREQCVYLIERDSVRRRMQPAASPAQWQATAAAAIATMKRWEDISEGWEQVAIQNQRTAERFQRVAVDCLEGRRRE